MLIRLGARVSRHQTLILEKSLGAWQSLSAGVEQGCFVSLEAIIDPTASGLHLRAVLKDITAAGLGHLHKCFHAIAQESRREVGRHATAR